MTREVRTRLSQTVSARSRTISTFTEEFNFAQRAQEILEKLTKMELKLARCIADGMNHPGNRHRCQLQKIV